MWVFVLFATRGNDAVPEAWGSSTGGRIIARGIGDITDSYVESSLKYMNAITGSK